MKNNFWKKLKKQCGREKRPILALAPMAGVADSAFRQICKGFGADVVYSEMSSAAALVFNPGPTLEMIQFGKKERPYVVQLFGSNPEHFAAAARLVTKKIKPDGIDINFGCPVKKVQKQGAGAALMGDLDLSCKVVKAVLENTKLPVSVKCRASVPGKKGGVVTVLDFLKKIKDLDAAAIMIHGRTMAQGHAGPVDAAIIREARKYFSGVILANGGVGRFLAPNPSSALADEGRMEYAEWLLRESGADGLGIGQGALGNPSVFKQLRIKNYELRIKEIFSLALKHARLAYKLKGKAGILEMRKHLCWYVAGLPNASELRRQFVRVESLKEIEEILKTSR